jgi:N-formylglutamate amidohydrolase
MTPAEDFATVAPFVVHSPPRQRVPFVFNSPHSGSYYPPRFLAMSRLDPHAIRRSEDCYVDELFSGVAGLGAPMLAANFPRAYLDVNREALELDPRMFSGTLPARANTRSPRVAGGLGTVPSLVGEGQTIYATKLPVSEAIARIDTVYRPYHRMLERLVERTHALFGVAVLIDCHSMPASVRIGEAGLRPDFIIGDRFGTSCSGTLTELAIGTLSAMGYTVAHNKPYAGGHITEHYGRPARGYHALQIEINRGLYMNETTLARTGGFTALAEDLTQLAAELTQLPPEHLNGLPLAAE